jgi:23S rRNA (pseudouridine1915-N3)-methyltransferase
MKWILFDFKTSKEAWFEQALTLYLKKIKHYAQFEVTHLKTISLDRDSFETKKNFEEKILFDKITNDDFVILFDEKGKKIDSMQFSQVIEKANSSGKKRGVLVIGGAYGVSDEIKNRSNILVSLSDLTMNHLVAEVMLLEQFYRAQTILNRIPYHNA